MLSHSESSTQGNINVAVTTGHRRLLGLDALRGLAVLLMVQQHLMIWFWQGPGPGESLDDYQLFMALNGLGGGAAPLFITLAGVGASLMTVRQATLASSLNNSKLVRQTPQRHSNPLTSIDYTFLKRGVVLLGFGYLLNVLVSSWFSLSSWYVLHLIGLGLLLVPLWRRMSDRALVGAATIVVGSTGLWQAWLDTPLSLNSEFMAGRSPISATSWIFVRLAFVEGLFPIFPWLSFFIVGVVAGRFIAQGQPAKLTRLALAAGAVSVAGLIVGLSVDLNPASPLERTMVLQVPFFPASPTLTLMLISGVLFALRAIGVLEARRPFYALSPLVTLGRGSLTVLLVHIWLFRELLNTDEGWRTKVSGFGWLGDQVGLWQSQTVATTLVLVALVAIVITAALRWWASVDYRYGAEWVLRRLTAPKSALPIAVPPPATTGRTSRMDSARFGR